MSFSIRPVYKQRNVSAFTADDAFTADEQQRNKEITEAILRHTKKSSYQSLVDNPDFESIIKNSSLNPDINPVAKSIVDQMRQQRKKKNIISIKDDKTQVEPLYGFSSSSSGQLNQGDKNKIMDAALQKEIDAINAKYDGQHNRDVPDELKNILENDDNVPNGEEHDQVENSESLSKEEKEKMRQKHTLSYAYPKSASLVRGLPQRTTSMVGHGVRRVPLGSADAY